MNENKILLYTLLLALLGLTIAFVLLFTYVNGTNLASYREVVSPAGAILSTAAMLVVGLSVFAARNRRNRHQ